MQRLLMVVCALASLGISATVAISADERRHLMKKVVAPAAKLGGQMVKGVEPFDAAKAAKAMNEISGVPDKYVTSFLKGTEQGAVPDSEALPKVWEDFDHFKELANKLEDASSKAAGAAEQGLGSFKASLYRPDQGLQGMPRELSFQRRVVAGPA